MGSSVPVHIASGSACSIVVASSRIRGIIGGRHVLSMIRVVGVTNGAVGLAVGGGRESRGGCTTEF